MRASALWLLVCLFLAACFGGAAAVDRYYRLEAAPPAEPLASLRLPGSLRVTPFRADGLARATALLHSDAAQPLEVARYSSHHWVDSPTRMLQLQTSRFLRAAGVADSVLPSDATARADWLVSGRIRRIERVDTAEGPRALLEIDLQLARGSDREPIFQRSYREERPAGPDVRDAVAGMNDALGAILRRFVRDLPESA